MKRKMSISLYILALLITVLIFGLGVYLGTIIDKSKVSNISSEVQTISQRLSNTQLLLLLEDSSSFCPLYKDELDNLDRETEKIGLQLQFLEDAKGIVDIELKKQYFVLEAQSYLLSQKVNEKCESNDDVLLLYFYSNKNCENCKKQGEYILSARENIKSKNFSIKIYSFDGDLGTPIVDALKNKYSISLYPSIVINERIIPGFLDVNKIEDFMINAY